MSKGIFQSGSIGRCEKQSDVFHHIRYAGSPRDAIPHKSMEIPKPLLSLEDYKEAESNLEKRLLSQGYGSSNAIISKAAKGIKAFLFFFFYIPYYLVLQLPMTVVSIGLGLLKYLILRVYTPAVQFISRMATIVKGWSLGLDLSRFWALFSFAKAKEQRMESEVLNKKEEALDAVVFEKELMEKEQTKKDKQFWKNWTLPTFKLPSFRLGFKEFSFFGWFKKYFTFKLPSLQWNWKQWIPVLPKWEVNFKAWAFPRWKWEIPGVWTRKLSDINWKLPEITFDGFNGVIRRMMKKISLVNIQWNLSPLLETFKHFVSRFRWNRRVKTQKTRDKFKAAVGTVGEQIVEFFDGLVSYLPELPQEALRGIGRGITWIFLGVVDRVRRSTLFVWRIAVKVFSTLMKVQENLQKISSFTSRIRMTTKALAIKGVDTASKPVVRAIEKTHSAMIPMRLQMRRWTFLTGIMVELSLLMLGEAIIQFEKWNQEKWISRFVIE